MADVYIPRFGGSSAHCGNGVRQSLSLCGGCLLLSNTCISLLFMFFISSAISRESLEYTLSILDILCCLMVPDSNSIASPIVAKANTTQVSVFVRQHRVGLWRNVSSVLMLMVRIVFYLFNLK